MGHFLLYLAPLRGALKTAGPIGKRRSWPARSSLGLWFMVDCSGRGLQLIPGFQHYVSVHPYPIP